MLRLEAAFPVCWQEGASLFDPCFGGSQTTNVVTKTASLGNASPISIYHCRLPSTGRHYLLMFSSIDRLIKRSKKSISMYFYGAAVCSGWLSWTCHQSQARKLALIQMQRQARTVSMRTTEEGTCCATSRQNILCHSFYTFDLQLFRIRQRMSKPFSTLVNTFLLQGTL